MWEPFRLSIEQWAPQCSIVYDKFHILQHANEAVDEVRRAEFFRKGPKMRDLITGKKWLLLSRWKNLEAKQRGVLNRLFQLNRRVFKAYMLKESLERLWDYRYEGAMLNYLKKWIAQLRWQRLCQRSSENVVFGALGRGAASSAPQAQSSVRSSITFGESSILSAKAGRNPAVRATGSGVRQPSSGKTKQSWF